MRLRHAHQSDKPSSRHRHTPYAEWQSRPSTIVPASQGWSSCATIRDSDDEYQIVLPLRDVEQRTIDLSVLEGTLTIHTVLPETSPVSFGSNQHISGYNRHQAATFRLPIDADARATHASTHEGLLIVHVPKFEKSSAPG